MKTQSAIIGKESVAPSRRNSAGFIPESIRWSGTQVSSDNVHDVIKDTAYDANLESITTPDGRAVLADA